MDIIFFITISILSRLAPHIPNVTAVGAVTLFAATRYSLKKSMIIFLLTMILSDIFLGFHTVMWATYGSFGLTFLLGRMIRNSLNWKSIGFMTFVSSLQFFIITNFAVWLTGSLYSKTAEGFIHCYWMALPFFRNSLIGDFFYALVFFGSYEVVKQLSHCKPAVCTGLKGVKWDRFFVVRK